MMKRILIGIAAASAAVLAQDFFPLQTGNQWVFRGSRFGQTRTVEVGEVRAFGGVEYFQVRGFAQDGQRWLRRNSEGAVVEFDQSSNAERPFLSLNLAAGERFETSIHECNKTGVIASREAKLSIPGIGDFSNAVEVQYQITNCADFGFTNDFFLADVGPVKRVETSIAGPVTYELLYARVNGFLTLAQPETSFALSILSPIEAGGRIVARMTVRNGNPKEPLRLNFTSGQIFNLEVRDAAGEVVYNWASDKLFVAALQSIDVQTEKNWLVEFEVPNGLRPGTYTVEAYLTVSGTPDRPYRARVPLVVSSR
jgi:hypothetical protein